MTRPRPIPDDAVFQRMRQAIHDADNPTAGEVLQLVDDVMVDGADWLDRLHPSLGGVSPRSLLGTQEGRQRVVDILLAIRYGGPV